METLVFRRPKGQSKDFRSECLHVGGIGLRLGDRSGAVLHRPRSMNVCPGI